MTSRKFWKPDGSLDYSNVGGYSNSMTFNHKDRSKVSGHSYLHQPIQARHYTDKTYDGDVISSDVVLGYKNSYLAQQNAFNNTNYRLNSRNNNPATEIHSNNVIYSNDVRAMKEPIIIKSDDIIKTMGRHNVSRHRLSFGGGFT